MPASRACNYLQNVVATTYKKFLQFYAKRSCKKQSDGYLNGVPIYRITKQHQWNLLLVTSRAHGESGGEFSTLGIWERYDCRDWANWAAKRFGAKTSIFLMGVNNPERSPSPVRFMEITVPF